jgi:hypothetical protein
LAQEAPLQVLAQLGETEVVQPLQVSLLLAGAAEPIEAPLQVKTADQVAAEQIQKPLEVQVQPVKAITAEQGLLATLITVVVVVVAQQQSA